MIADVAHICIAARDLEETERFYCQGLGLGKTFTFMRGGKRVGFYLEVSEGRYIEVFENAHIAVSENHPIMHMCLLVKDIDALRERLTADGIAVTEKQLGADHSWQVWATDPSGVRIEFHQYTPESCQLTGEDCVLP